VGELTNYYKQNKVINDDDSQLSVDIDEALSYIRLLENSDQNQWIIVNAPKSKFP